jgi:CRP/FNR family transcriptional regulator
MIEPHDLAGVALFAGLNEAAQKQLRQASAACRFAPGDLLWREGETPRGLFVLLQGRVRILRTRNGRQYVVHHEGVGATLGELPLFDGGAYPATAVAASPVRGLRVSEAGVRAAITADPRLAYELLARLGRRLRVLLDRLHDATVTTVRVRLAAHLLARATLAPGKPFNLGGTQSHVAEELGTVREVLARELAFLRRHGMIALAGRGRYRVTDDAALESLVSD